MSEVKTVIESDFQGNYIIRPEHTFADCVRFLISQGCDSTECIALYRMEEE